MTEITMENMESQENIEKIDFSFTSNPQRFLKIHKMMIYPRDVE